MAYPLKFFPFLAFIAVPCCHFFSEREICRQTQAVLTADTVGTTVVPPVYKGSRVWGAVRVGRVKGRREWEK